MEESLITSIFLPLALAVVMLGMGLSLEVRDFKRIFLYPKAIGLGLFNQLILLPLVGFGIALLFNLSPHLAVGIMLLASCPGGATSNLIAHLARGNTALSISLTAFSSVITIITIPLIMEFSMDFFMGEEREVRLNVPETIKQIFIIVVIPVITGMFIRKRSLYFANRMEKPVKRMSAVILAIVILGAVLGNLDILKDAILEAGLPTLLLNLTMMSIGFLSGYALLRNLKDSVTICIETGIQNGTLAIYIALTIIGESSFSIAPAIYSLLMFGSGIAAIQIFKRRISD